MDETAQRRLRTRLSVLTFVVFGLVLALFSRLWYLQVLAGDRYGELAEGNRVRQVLLEAPRGRVLDAKGRVLVDNRVAWAVTVKTAELGERRSETLDRLARLLGVRRATIDERLERWVGSPFRGVPVAEDVRPEVLFDLTEHREQFPGVEPAVVALRRYPYGTLAAHVLGYPGEISPDQLRDKSWRGYHQGDVVGKAGVELTWDRQLRGRDGFELLEVNAVGEVVRTLDRREPVRGRDLRLNLDLDVQRVAEQTLASGIEAARRLPDRQRGGTYPAPAATAVVLDVRDGGVLALASLPQYDPRRFVGGISRKDFARYHDSPAKPLLDRAVQSVYPPGSTWKAFTALAGLDAGIVTAGTPFTCTGSYTLGTETKSDWTRRGHGSVDLNRSLAQSCDVYYYTLGDLFWQREKDQAASGRPAAETMQATAREFGFDKAPQIDLPFVAEGTVPDRQWRRSYWQANKDTYCKGTSRLYQELCTDGAIWRGGDSLNLSIGQGDLLVSPLQLAAAYAALANGGTVYQPHVVGALLDPGTRQVTRQVASKVDRVAKVPAGALAAVGDGLRAVTTAGTGATAFAGFPMAEHPVAGKTGTADLPPNAPFAWFASYAPADDPRWAVVVMVEQGGHGGETAAPIARRICEQLMGLDATEVRTGTDSSG
jgi:penicillin-binding protein 2